MTAITNLLQGIDSYADEIPEFSKNDLGKRISAVWKTTALFDKMVVVPGSVIRLTVNVLAFALSLRSLASEISLSPLLITGAFGYFAYEAVGKFRCETKKISDDWAMISSKCSADLKAAKNILSLYLAFKGKHPDELRLIVECVLQDSNLSEASKKMLFSDIARLQLRLRCLT